MRKIVLMKKREVELGEMLSLLLTTAIFCSRFWKWFPVCRYVEQNSIGRSGGQMIEDAPDKLINLQAIKCRHFPTIKPTKYLSTMETIYGKKCRVQNTLNKKSDLLNTIV